MNDIITWLKGKKTVIINVLTFIVASIGYFGDFNWLDPNVGITAMILSAANTILRFFTDSPIFDNGVKKK